MSKFVNPNLIARLVAFAMIAMLASCAAPRPAPVSDARPATNVETPATVKPADTTAVGEAAKPADSAKLHVVQRGETLYSIAFQNGIDYRELAAWNNIVNPAMIRVGDSLRLSAPDTAAPTAMPLPQPGVPVATPLVNTPGAGLVPDGSPLANSAQMKVEPKAGRVPYSDAAYTKMLAEGGAAAVAAAPTLMPAAPAVSPVAAQPTGNNDGIVWAWPVKGKVLSTFTDLNKGIDIAGTRGAPVFAVAAGKVLHSGSTLRGYGRLVIIKHNDTWLSAYAHNEKLLVNEGDEIKKGQKIAEMGSSDADSVKLHFEIRNKGRPVDPLKFLPPQ